MLEKTAVLRPYDLALLPADTIARLGAAAKPAILEIAGRDSLAAARLAVTEGGYDVVWPTVAYAGTEYGDARGPSANVRVLRSLVEEKGAEVLPAVALADPALWHLLCGRYLAASFRRFGFFTPCVGCHLYFHALRLPLARAANCRAVVAGERESHAGAVKVNQISVALDAYVALARRFDVDLVLPLRHVSEDGYIAQAAGAAWPSENDPRCVLAGNYRDARGAAIFDAAAVRRYLDEFALPVATGAVEAYLAGRPPDYETLATGLW